MDNVESIDLKDCGSAAITSDGNLWIWGKTGTIVGTNEEGRSSEPIVVKEGVVEISVGYSHNAVIVEDGNFWVCGYNYAGQLGNGKANYYLDPQQVYFN